MVALGEKRKSLHVFFLLVCRFDVFVFVQCTSYLNLYIPVNRNR